MRGIYKSYDIYLHTRMFLYMYIYISIYIYIYISPELLLLTPVWQSKLYIYIYIYVCFFTLYPRAAAADSCLAIKALLSAGAAISAQTPNGTTPLHLAASSGNPNPNYAPNTLPLIPNEICIYTYTYVYIYHRQRNQPPTSDSLFRWQ
jgi:hypothetical protein